MIMDERQKKAIRTLNRLLTMGQLEESEYFDILDLVTEEKTVVTYNPPQVPQYPTFPFVTWQGEPLKYEITCKSSGFGDQHDMASSIKDAFK